MADKSSGQKASASASARATAALEKVTAREKKAQKKLAEVSKTLGVAISALIGVKTGSSGEKKAQRKVRAAVAGLVRAKRKLKKAQRKRKKAVAKQLKERRTRATATDAKTATPRQRLSVVRTAPRKPRRITGGASAAASALAVEEGMDTAPEVTHREDPASLD